MVSVTVLFDEINGQRSNEFPDLLQSNIKPATCAASPLPLVTPQASSGGLQPLRSLSRVYLVEEQHYSRDYGEILSP